MFCSERDTKDKTALEIGTVFLSGLFFKKTENYMINFKMITIAKTYGENLDLEKYRVSGVFTSDIKIKEVKSEDIHIIALDSDIKPFVYKFDLVILEYNDVLKYIDLINAPLVEKIKILKELITEVILTSIALEQENVKNEEYNENKVIRPL